MAENKILYRRNFELGLIASLAIIIAIILIYPSPGSGIPEPPSYSEPIITVIDIPQTIQQPAPPVSLPPPAPIVSFMFAPVGEPELLENVSINEKKTPGSYSENSIMQKSATSSVFEYSSLPFIPRQILEVVPEKVDGAEGIIKLKLRIGTDGFVKEHDLYFDSTQKPECLKKVLSAVYRSRWQPITIEGNKIEYWLEKNYLFE